MKTSLSNSKILLFLTLKILELALNNFLIAKTLLRRILLAKTKAMLQVDTRTKLDPFTSSWVEMVSQTTEVPSASRTMMQLTVARLTFIKRLLRFKTNVKRSLDLNHRLLKEVGGMRCCLKENRSWASKDTEKWGVVKCKMFTRVDRFWPAVVKEAIDTFKIPHLTR